MAVSVPRPFYVDPLQYLFAAAQNAGSAGQFAATLEQLAGSLVAPVITPVFPDGPTAPAISVPTPPSLITFSWNVPGLPSVFNKGLNIDPYLPAPFDGTPPVLNFGTAPLPDYGPTPPAPPINTDFPFPDDPVIVFPPPPALLSIQTYPFDGVTIPDFTDDLQPLQIADPTIYQYTPGTGFTSSLLTKVLSVLEQRMNGGTGLPPAVEQAIWDRGREREARQLADNQMDLERMESLGYAFPPGVWLDARLKLLNEYQAQSAGFSREVMIKQAELEQQNIRDAIQQSIVIESKLIDQYNMIEQRIFEAAKYMTNAAIETYNAKVKAYAAYCDAYKTKAAIYDAQIKGLLAKVEVYKTEIQAEEIKAQINTALVQQYKAQIDAQMALVEIFKAELSAIQTKASIEKLKIEVYGEQIKAFVGTVNAYSAEVDGYKAAVGAEETKMQAYKATVDAYAAEVGAQVKVIDAKIAEYEGWIKAKESEYDGYKAATSGEGARVGAISSFNTSQADVYKAVVSGTSSYNEMLTKQWQVAFDQAQRVSDIANNVAKMNADLYMQARGIAMDAAKVGAQVYSQLAAACLNAINWSTSYSVSLAGSSSESASTSQSNSYSYSYNYSESL
jgi:hypothetical protein